MGVAIPGGAFELIDTDGNVITEPHVTGELRYRGANVTLGYADDSADLTLCKRRRARRRAGNRRYGAGGRGRLLYHRWPQKAIF